MTTSIFNTSTLHAKIQGLSIQVGQLFAELYAGGSSTQGEWDRQGNNTLRGSALDQGSIPCASIFFLLFRSTYHVKT